MGKMSDKDIEKQESPQDSHDEHDLDVFTLLKKSGLKLVFNDKDLEKMVKIMEKSKDDTSI